MLEEHRKIGRDVRNIATWEVVNNMAQSINKKISDKIKESNLSEETKDFLASLLIFEFEHFEEARPRYMDEYEKLIKKYTAKLEEEEK